MKRIQFILLFLFLLTTAFAADEKRQNGLFISVNFAPFYFDEDDNTPKMSYGLLEYRRFFDDYNLSVSIGTGYTNLFQKSYFAPFTISYIPFDTIIRPYIFAGGVLMYNADKEYDYSVDDPVFDKGLDVCFIYGVGIMTAPVFSRVVFGIQFNLYTDFGDSMNGHIVWQAGYMF